MTHCDAQVEDIKSIEVKQFRHAEKWCIDNIDLTFDEKTKKFGEIGFLENLISDDKSHFFRSVANCFRT